MEFNKIEFGMRVQEARRAKGLTQEQLAEILNVSIECLSKLERGIRSSSIELLVALTVVLDVSADYLLTGTDKVMAAKCELQVALDSLSRIVQNM